MTEPGLEWTAEHLGWMYNERFADNGEGDSEQRIHEYLVGTDESQRRELILTASRAYSAASLTNGMIRVLVQDGPPTWLPDVQRDAISQVFSIFQSNAIADAPKAREIATTIAASVVASRIALVHMIDGLGITQKEYGSAPDWNWDAQTAPVEPVGPRSDAPSTAESAFIDGMLAHDIGNIEGAVRSWTLAAEQGHIQATFNLGRLASRAGDRESAIRHYGVAAQGGWAPAMLNLGVLARDAGDTERATTWFQSAADHGEVAATTCLGDLAKERGDMREACMCYEVAADQGDALAMFRLGHFAKSVGDRASARQHYERAAAAGSAEAMFNLSVMADEDGDPTLERHWLNQAVELGDAAAMVNLAVCEIQAQDISSARALLQQAASLGNEVAVRHLDVLNSG